MQGKASTENLRANGQNTKIGEAEVSNRILLKMKKILLKSTSILPCRSTMQRINDLQLKWYKYVDGAPEFKIKKKKSKHVAKKHYAFRSDPSDKWGKR